MISKTVEKMRVDLSRYGINDVREVVYNPSYETLFAEETDSRLEGYERGQLCVLGAVILGLYNEKQIMKTIEGKKER